MSSPYFEAGRGGKKLDRFLNVRLGSSGVELERQAAGVNKSLLKAEQPSQPRLVRI
jgi:hypothetical protein